MLLLLLSYLWLAVVVSPAADTAQRDSGMVILPVEVLGEDGTTIERTLSSPANRANVHEPYGCRYTGSDTRSRRASRLMTAHGFPSAMTP